MKKPFYITTPIYYPSGNPHIGHCYTTVACDAMARYKRARGYDVMFLTGTDEHGQKIETKATEAGISPKEYVDGVVTKFKKLWEFMSVDYDRFIRTTDDYHRESVQKIFKDLYDRGYIYKDKYVGKYCAPCESFWTELQLVDGNCPDCGRPVADAEEEAYFFKLSLFNERLQDLLETGTFLFPDFRVNEMVNSFLKEGLQDLCVTRTSFSWGVPISFDEGHIVYVWIDALSNYITALGYQNDQYDDFERYWPADIHVMAKEIVRFHSLIWPAILMALELPLPKKVYAHGWITFGDKKMSKSLGNVVDPFILGERYGVDAMRYYMLREMSFGNDLAFSNELMLSRINTDLSNDFGNLVSRTAGMLRKYYGERLPVEREIADVDLELQKLALATVANFEENMDDFHLGEAYEAVNNLISKTNKYIDVTMPWVLAKTPESNARLATVLYHLCEIIRISSILLNSAIPNIIPQVWERLHLTEELTSWDSIHAFGALPAAVEMDSGDSLFPRIDIKKELEALTQLS